VCVWCVVCVCVCVCGVALTPSPPSLAPLLCRSR
jgi:hypothetical protein